MSPWREVFVRKEEINWNKNRKLKCLKRHYSTVRSMKNVAVLTEAGHLPSFLVPTPEDLTAQESPLPGICHPRQNQKNADAWGSARGGAGGGGASRSWNWLCIMSGRIEYCRKNLVANCFGNFGKKKNKTNCQKCIANSTRTANCSKTLLLMFVAILAKIYLIGIAGKNLVFKRAVSRNSTKLGNYKMPIILRET